MNENLLIGLFSILIVIFLIYIVYAISEEISSFCIFLRNNKKDKMRKKYPEVCKRVKEYNFKINWENRPAVKNFCKVRDELDDLRELLPSRTSKELIVIEKKIDDLVILKSQYFIEYKEELDMLDKMKLDLISLIKKQVAKKDLKNFTKLIFDDDGLHEE